MRSLSMRKATSSFLENAVRERLRAKGIPFTKGALRRVKRAYTKLSAKQKAEVRII